MRSRQFTRITRLVLVLVVLALVVVAAVMALSRLPGNTLSYAEGDATPTPDPDALEVALERARTFSGSNDDWEPFVWDFDGVEMVLVPAGCFMMGSTEYQIDAALAQCSEEFSACEREWLEHEGPAHKVCFEEPFWIDRYEVTQAQFAAFGGVAEKTNHFAGDDLPQESITWDEAQDFCERRGAQLPTEAEWEYTARGPEAWIYPWGNEFVGDHVVYRANSTIPVGSHPEGVSWVGALDMSGNVWEWVADWRGANYYGTLEDGAVNPTGPETGRYRVLRGGSWNYYNTIGFRAAFRYRNLPQNGLIDYGFRCARSAFN